MVLFSSSQALQLFIVLCSCSSGFVVEFVFAFYCLSAASLWRSFFFAYLKILFSAKFINLITCIAPGYDDPFEQRSKPLWSVDISELQFMYVWTCLLMQAAINAQKEIYKLITCIIICAQYMHSTDSTVYCLTNGSFAITTIDHGKPGSLS